MYLSAIETLICGKEMSFIGSTSFSFAQNTIHNFRNTHGTHSGIVCDKCHHKNMNEASTGQYGSTNATKVVEGGNVLNQQ